MAPIDRIIQATATLGTHSDEVAILADIAERLVKGRRVYGDLDIAREKRDMSRETFEELTDALVYMSILLKRT